MFNRLILFLFLVGCCHGLCAQTESFQPKEEVPPLAVKSNLLYAAFTNLNLGVEFSTGDQYTLDLSLNYNPWTFSNNRKFKHILVQPELRYWFDHRFDGFFVGVHGVYADYNVGNVTLPFSMFPSLKSNRYQGWLLGAGISCGYNWDLAAGWSLEATIGFGYVYTNYNRYECIRCGDLIERGTKNYLGPTKVGLSLLYILRRGQVKASQMQDTDNTIY